MSFYQAYTHNGDDMALEGLGLSTGPWAHGDYSLVGVVFVDERASIKVEVCCLPAQFWRFTIFREVDAEGPTEFETLEMKTGSGSFQMYWPTAKLLAENMVVVERA